MHDEGGANPDPAESQPDQGAPPLVVRVTIKRFVRDMDVGAEEGGSDPKLLGDTDGRLWLVKAINNPQGTRMLASEYLAAALGARLGATIQPGGVCNVPDELAQTLKFSSSGNAWAGGEGFGSAFMDGTKPYLDSMSADIKNRDALLGPIAIDTLLTLHDTRQARVRDADSGGYRVLPVDFGYCLGPGNWDAAALAGRPAVAGLFDPRGWSAGASAAAASSAADTLAAVTDEEIKAIIDSIPPAWGLSDADRDALVTFVVNRRVGVVAALRGLAPAAP